MKEGEQFKIEFPEHEEKRVTSQIPYANTPFESLSIPQRSERIRYKWKNNLELTKEEQEEVEKQHREDAEDNRIYKH